MAEIEQKVEVKTEVVNVSQEEARRAILLGRLVNRYGGVSVYLYRGNHYFIPRTMAEECDCRSMDECDGRYLCQVAAAGIQQ